MLAPTGNGDTMSKLCRVAWIAGIGLSTLVAVGVAALFLALLGAARTSSAPRRAATAIISGRAADPVPRHRSTTTTAGTQTSPARRNPSASGRAEDFDGAVSQGPRPQPKGIFAMPTVRSANTPHIGQVP
jgi:hypothetical protein